MSNWNEEVLDSRDRMKQIEYERTEAARQRQQREDWLQRRIEELERERDEAVDEVLSLQSVTCVYCGYEYGPSGDTPRAKAAILTEHIAVCSEHPLAEARAYARRLYGWLSWWMVDESAHAVLADAPEWVKEASE